MITNINLRNAISQRNLTQRQLADKIGIPESYISLAIHGRFILTPEQQSKISKALKRPRKELFGGK